MNNLIAVTIGDIRGIGIELLISEWKKGSVKNFILITNFKIFSRLKILSKRNVNIINNINKLNFQKTKFNILNFETKNEFSNTFESLNIAYAYTKQKYFIGILTLPLNKSKISKNISKNFIDQTTFFSKLENNNITNMVLIHNNKFFIPLTLHIELKKVYKYFKNKNLIINKIKNILNTVKKDFNIKNPKILIAGINPHSGENNIISTDENKLLKPVIKSLKKLDINISGPISGDGMINDNNLKNYDAFIFTYHDQALIPFKIVSKYEGVNFTSNLDIIRVSPSHGTGYDLLKSKKASSKGIINCFKLINKIYKNRK